MKLSGKTALICGASRFLGLHIARNLALQGAKLVLPYYDWPESIAEMKEEFAAHLCIKADLRDEHDVQHVIQETEKHFGRLDLVINNIERGGMPIVHGPYTPEQWQIEMETTLKAKWLIFQESLPLLQKQPSLVINISSIAGITGRKGVAGLIFNDAYVAANRGISSFTETWAVQGAPTVRVNEIMLGFFDGRHGKSTRGWPLLSRKNRSQLLKETLLHRTGRPDDLVKAVNYLIHDAPFMTGTILRLDGGYSLGGQEIPPMPQGLQEDLSIRK
jgi:3-oxoacyl-[acyl-carrier protein] reductase